jgi:hypothetical protein
MKSVNRNTNIWIAIALLVVVLLGVWWNSDSSETIVARNPGLITEKKSARNHRLLLSQRRLLTSHVHGSKGSRVLANPTPDNVRAQFKKSFVDARVWINARRDARRVDDIEAEEKSLTVWIENRNAIVETIRSNVGYASTFLADASAWEDSMAALYLAPVLSLVRVPGFEKRLSAIVLSDGAPTQKRRIALIGLRGRGGSAATIVDQVARLSSSDVLCSQATEELGFYLEEQGTLDGCHQYLETLAVNLEHPALEVRLAGVRSLLKTSGALPGFVRTQLGKTVAIESDEGVREMARRILARFD